MRENTRMAQVDFSTSVRSEDIMKNFYELENQLRSERLRAAGYGILDGFDRITVDGMNININSGRFVNKAGDVIEVESKTLAIPSLLPKEITYANSFDQASYKVSELGEFELNARPYSMKKRGFIDMDYYKENYPEIEDEFCVKISDTNVKVADIQEKNIVVDARYRDKEATVYQLRAQNRVDIVTIREDGTFNIIESVVGTESAAANREDYEDEFVVCYVKTFVAETDYLVVYDYPPYRDVRPVYVDDKNNLYLNGVLYEGAFIHFEEPVAPMLHTFWYDTKSNQLFVWLDTEGIEQWVAVNSNIEKSTTYIQQFTPKTCPKDLQTFMFKDSEEYKFDPDLYQVTVNINNNVLMKDEFTAILEDDEEGARGIGIKLLEPLDDPAYVECIITRNVQANPINTIFERVGTYIDEGAYFYTSEAKDLDGIYFDTEGEYRIGECQLEVYKNGLKLVKDLDYKESDGAKTSLGKGFTLKEKAADGDRISYRISQSVFSYAHLTKLLEKANTRAEKAEASVEELSQKIETIQENATDIITELTDRVNTMEKLFSQVNDYLHTDSVLGMNNMPAQVLDGVRNRIINKSFKTSPTISIEELGPNDFFVVTHTGKNTSTRVLEKDIDFELLLEGTGIELLLSQEVIVEEGIIGVNGIHFGK